MFKQLQQVGKAFMLPIAILPAAGLLLGIGGALSNKATVQAYPILNNEALQGLFQIMSAAGCCSCCGCRLSHYDGYHCCINSDFLF